MLVKVAHDILALAPFAHPRVSQALQQSINMNGLRPAREHTSPPMATRVPRAGETPGSSGLTALLAPRHSGRGVGVRGITQKKRSATKLNGRSSHGHAGGLARSLPSTGLLWLIAATSRRVPLISTGSPG